MEFICLFLRLIDCDWSVHRPTSTRLVVIGLSINCDWWGLISWQVNVKHDPWGWWLSCARSPAIVFTSSSRRSAVGDKDIRIHCPKKETLFKIGTTYQEIGITWQLRILFKIGNILKIVRNKKYFKRETGINTGNANQKTLRFVKDNVSSTRKHCNKGEVRYSQRQHCSKCEVKFKG